MQSSDTDSTLRVAGSLLRLVNSSGNTDQLLRDLASQACGMSPEEEKAAQEAFQALVAVSPRDGGNAKKVSANKQDRGYIDGCYDLCHSGHFNALRQAAEVCHTVVIGPNSDESIIKTKGPTILSGQERAEILRAVKWGDQVSPDMPYDPSIEILDQVNCQFYIHGDDPVMIDGANICDFMREQGRFKEIRRTTGVSTTDLTGKLLALLEHTDEEAKTPMKLEAPKQNFLQTSARIANFSNRRTPKITDRVVYFQLSCDLMHPGVIERLNAAKAQGDFLYVGLWDDTMIKYYRGSRYPLQGMQERLLMALAMKPVDDVVIGAPYIVTDDLIKSLGITKVVHIQSREDQVRAEFRELDPFEVPKAQGIFEELPPVQNDLTLEDIAARVQANKGAFEKKFKSKKAKEDDYYLNMKKSTSQMGENPEGITPTSSDSPLKENGAAATE